MKENAIRIFNVEHLDVEYRKNLNFIDEKCVENLQKYKYTDLKNQRGIFIGNISAHIEV